MKLLRIIATVDPRSGGPVEGLIQQAPILEKNNIQMEILTLDDPSAPYVAECPVHVHALGSAQTHKGGWRRFLPWVHYGYTPNSISWLRQHANAYDLVGVHGLWNFSTMMARYGLRGTGVPYIVFTHGMLDPWFRKAYPLKNALKQIFWWFCEGPLLSGAKAVAFTTEAERTLARNAFFPYHIQEKVIHYGTRGNPGQAEVQVAKFRASLPALGKRRYLVFLSRIHPKKGCDLLIRSFAKVAHQYPELDLVLAGPDQTGWVSKLKALAETLGVADRIHWPGMLTGDLKWGAYCGAEAFILPSHQENFGIVVAEAMACGKPVLITNKVNIWQEIETAEAGLVANDDLAGAEDLLTRFLAMPEQARLQMGQAARNTFLKNFEINHAAHSIITLMRQAAGKE